MVSESSKRLLQTLFRRFWAYLYISLVCLLLSMVQLTLRSVIATRSSQRYDCELVRSKSEKTFVASSLWAASLAVVVAELSDSLEGDT